MWVCCVCICTNNFKQTTIVDMWLHDHQQNKQKKLKYSQWWAVELDQFCWGARAKMTIEIPKTVVLVIS